MNELVIQNRQVVSCDALSELANIFDCNIARIQLNEKEQSALLFNFKSEYYDVAAEITWRRTMSILKERLSIFGDDFIGDMLGYDRSISADKISEQEVIELNCDVGFLRQDAKMELLHHADQINMYTSRKYQMVERVSFDKFKALSLISDCIKYVLSDMTEIATLKFNDIRKLLCTELMNDNHDFVIALDSAEYFEKRTILRSLMNMARTEKEEEKATVFQNMRIIIPRIWNCLSERDKYSFGTTYAMISNTDKKDYINVIRGILVEVHGFDYVPENLKSISFVDAAKHLLNVHNGLNNFYNEPLAAKQLADMGTMIPDPAVYECITVTFICATGNGYGVSEEAIPYFNRIFNSMSLQKWEMFFRDLRYNSELLYQLGYVGNESMTLSNWCDIINSRKLSDMRLESEWINEVFCATKVRDYSSIRSKIKNMYKSIKKTNSI